MQNKQISIEQAFALATEHLKAGRLPDAEKIYRGILQAQPAHALANHNLGLIAHRVGRNDIAAELFAKAIAANPSNSAFHVNLGQALRALGKIEEAIASYQRAIAANPSDAYAHSNLGHLFLAERRPAEAAQMLLRGFELKPDDFEARLAYAQILLGDGRHGEALAQLETAGKYANRPNFNHATLGKIYARAGETAKARTFLEAALKKDPADAEGCALVLAALGATAAPDRAPDAYLKKLYAERAGEWDRNVERDHNYRGMALVDTELRRLMQNNPARSRLRVLDAGCGTGLVGKRVRDLAVELHGVDLSQAMLQQAQLTGVYNRLLEGDMLEFMRMNPASYDAIVSAATLIHFGELGPVFQATAGALKPGGVFVFTLFPHADPATFGVGSLHGFAEGGCYFHGKDYVALRAADAGLDVLGMAEEIHEFTEGKPVTGLVVSLRRKLP